MCHFLSVSVRLCSNNGAMPHAVLHNKYKQAKDSLCWNKCHTVWQSNTCKSLHFVWLRMTANNVIHLLWMAVRETVILLHILIAQSPDWGCFLRKWNTILQSHTGTGMDGSEQKKSSRVLDTRLLRAHCSGFPQCLSLALSPTMIHTFHWITKDYLLP